MRSKWVAGCVVLAVGFLPACSNNDPSPQARAQPPSQPLRGEPESRQARQLTRYARLLAGVDDPLAAKDDPLRASEAFRVHAREMAALWESYNAHEATRIRPWVEQELAPVQQAQTLFYPFAGADFLFAHAFFPRARTYVLAGLERVGALADLDALPAKNVDLEYGRVQKAVTPLLQATFFRTLEMQSDTLQDGMLTILATLIAGTGHRILAVSTLAISKDGRVTERRKTDPPATAAGARIDFVTEGETATRTLYYFRTDLSDNGLTKQGGLLAFADTLPSKVSFAKAAAYLMHGQDFSTIRNYLLAHSEAVLQDDTGIPLRYFDRASWDVQFFGHYSQPIVMFMNYRQKDLAAAFEKGENVSPLDFHVGYGTSLASNLLLAVRRSAPGAAK